jgi:hypothetical protein
LFPFFCFVKSQNAELFTLTYGAMVRQLLTDLEEVEEVNKQLDQMYVLLYLSRIVCQFLKILLDDGANIVAIVKE